MADNSTSENSGKKIKVTVKSPKEKQEIEIDQDAAVKQLRELVAEKFSSPIEHLCMIFAGKILKDDETLTQNSIKDGMTVHLPIKSTNRTAAASSPAPAESTASTSTSPAGTAPTPDVSASTFGLGSLGGLAGIDNIDFGSDLLQRAQQAMQNPDMLRQLIKLIEENSSVQQMMSPDVMRQLLMAIPQVRDAMESNPKVTHMINNPELLRQTIKSDGNRVVLLQELNRSQDRENFMDNLESLLGRLNVLQRMCTEIQEPMMNAAQEGFESNLFAGLVGNTDGQAQAGRENTDPLPNPWEPRSTTASSSTSTTTTSTSSKNSSGQTGMFNTAGMSSLMSEFSANLQLMQNILQAPSMQLIMEFMSANPELANQNQPPEQRFATQLDQLAMMGFVDREANIRALLATFGDVNQAIERLLQQ